MKGVSMKKKRILSIYLLVLIIAGLISVPIWKQLEKTTSIAFSEKKRTVKVPTLKIIDEKSDSRPVAVMINNHNYARKNHSGLQDAFVIYEMIVEGGITRLMAIYKDKETDRIGSVRSSRHNFLDYASEYDAIYVHFGWSNLAKKDISSFGINNINGLYDNKGFWRDKSLKVPIEHTAFTNIERIIEVAKEKEYSLTTEKKIPLHYQVYPISLEKKEDAIKADKIVLRYSNYMTTSYTYDAENKVYKRYANDVEHVDAITKEQYQFKNIIVMKVKNYSVDSYERQNLDTVGTGEGYYITNGYARKIKWTKESRTGDTIYTYETGEEVLLNDGNTFIQVQPISEKTIIEGVSSDS
jgi:hypothetical protein